MLIKEYRIPLPLTVEEYRIAQLYMIQKKSREESSGEGSGVEIKVNEPYTDGPGGKGQYTHKIFHVGSHLPGWLKALLPKSAFIVEEEAWNAYPYTRTRYTCPFVEKFSLDIETVYKEDPGEMDNVFQLKGSELNERAVDLIDVVKDQSATASDYVRDEDPCLYVSRKTGRGPLTESWLHDYWRECKGNKLPLANGKAIMCAYKLCRVEFKYWGMQAKIERFIHDIALRKTMVRAHRQAWTWQDEWYGLTMEDIRELERQTQLALAKKMGAASGSVSGDEHEHSESSSPTVLTPAPPQAQQTADGANEAPTSTSASARTPVSPGVAPQWPMACISESSSSDDDEFFDCQEWRASGALSPAMVRWSSMELVPQGEDGDEMEHADKAHEETIEDKDSIFSPGYLQRYASANQRRPSRKYVSNYFRASGRSQSPAGSHISAPAATSAPNQPASALILVFHGGTVVDSTSPEPANKSADVATFQGNLDAVARQHFPGLSNGRLAVRLVSCPSLCPDAITVLNSLSPLDQSDQDSGAPVSSVWPPMGCLPLFAATSPEYSDAVSRTVAAANQIYAEFVRSPEGAGFSGPVTVVADSAGSILLYDALCKSEHDARYGSENSIDTTPGDDSANQDDDDHHHHHQQQQQQHNRSSFKKSHLLQAPPARRLSGSSSKYFLEFEVGDCFLLGSPLALVLAFRKWSHCHSEDSRSFISRPHCQGVYNLFHQVDPLAGRLEPLLSARFANTTPVPVPRYQRYPLGDGKSNSLAEFVQTNAHLFQDNAPTMTPPQTGNGTLSKRRQSDASFFHGSNNSLGCPELLAARMSSLSQRWWGSKRLDYAFYCPDGLTSFPAPALPHLLHASFWESADVAAFVLRTLTRTDGQQGGGSSAAGHDASDPSGGSLPFSPSTPCEKWIRKRTSVKIKNIGANHRANDLIVNETMPQVIVARFMYGPLDMVALTGEKVDVHFLRDATNGEWDLIASEVTDKTGRLVCTLPADRALPPGLHPIKMVVRGDHTYADMYVAVLPPRTQAVVFSIDGSFTASVSVTGRDPRVRAGAVDVVRHWQELGYLIVYITGRPDMQQRRVVSWLAQHNFPHGLLSFADGLSTDPLRHKAEYLRGLVNEVGLEVRAAYGSSKDISVYSSVGVKSDSIFIVGKISRKQQGQAQSLSEGYASHLANLAANQCRPAHINPYLLLPRGCLSLPGHGAPLLRRRSAKRATSFPGGASSAAASAGVATTCGTGVSTTAASAASSAASSVSSALVPATTSGGASIIKHS